MKRVGGGQPSVAKIFKRPRGDQGSDDDGTVLQGRCVDVMGGMEEESVALIFSSPPYNIGKSYEQPVAIADYLNEMTVVAQAMFRVLRLGGHLCWQVGNHVFDGEVTPLDLLFHPLFTKLGFVLQRRFIWTFGHGLHCQNRFSGRYETISWYTKGVSRHLPHPPAIVASEWSTLILDVPNVKSNHVEKTSHPCQFPVELVERFVLALTDPSDVILDPFGGAGSTVVAAVKQTRRGVSIECVDTYVQLAKSRLRLLRNGCLSTRPMGRAICDPASTGSLSAMPPGWSDVINPSCAAEQDFARTGKVR